MKAYEVVVKVPNSYEDATRIIFVQAESKKQLKEIDGVLRIYERTDVTLEECSFEVKFGAISSKM